MNNPKLMNNREEMKKEFGTAFSIQLPQWLKQHIAALPTRIFHSDSEKMSVLLEILRIQVERKTGGPFAAGIFTETGELVSVGVNVVVPSHTCIAHAEMLAFALAQKKYGVYSLALKSDISFSLFSTAQPCAMCCGAASWAGIRRLVYGAEAEDSQHLAGFDEGPIHPQWRRQLEQRGISIQNNCLRQDVCTLLRRYSDSGGIVYNGGQK
jgi:tRNA(Arg) A34 adenosine deaminase TadA